VTTEEEVSRYERLREAALGTVGGTNGNYGLALLVSRGMVAWLGALASYVPERAAVARGTASACGEDVRDKGEEITQILTSMAFGVVR
jgi:hypothetical protein